MVRRLLDDCADAGEVQMCVAVAAVLGKSVLEYVHESRLRQWYWGYAELCAQLGLHAEAADWMKFCRFCPPTRVPYTERQTQQTRVEANCAKCMKPFKVKVKPKREGDRVRRTGEGPPRCGGCQAASLCAVCEMPVKGLYVWCEGCSHGGHLHHLKEWFSPTGQGQRQCPTGCGHECDLREKLFGVGAST